MRGFGAAALTEQYQSPAGAALCVINDPPPSSRTSGLIGITSVLRSFSLQFTNSVTLDKNTATLALFSMFASSGYRVVVYTGATSGSLTDEVLSFAIDIAGTAGHFSMAVPIPPGTHSVTFNNNGSGAVREIWLDKVQQTIEVLGSPVDWTNNRPLTVGARANDGTTLPATDLPTMVRIHRARVGQETYTPAHVAEFADGGFPDTPGLNYEFPCQI